MITSDTVAVDSLGWADQGALWIYDFERQRERSIPVSGSKYLTVSPGGDDLFRVVHHGGASAALSVRSFSYPDLELASIRGDDQGAYASTGDRSLWRAVDAAALVNLTTGTKLLLIDAANSEVREVPLPWYNADNYDLLYQALVDCLALPDGEHIALAVQRSSDLVIVDRTNGEDVGKIHLAGQYGNPDLQLLSDNRLLTVDYDTLCMVDIVDRRMTASVRLQEAAEGTRHFVGDAVITPASQVAVARPFSGDVIFVDLDSFEILGTKHVGGQPLSLGCARNGDLVTRDWKTGAVRRTTWRL
jgi:hypothetical protein